MTPSQLKAAHMKAHPESRIFSRENMAFFGDTMRNFGTRNVTIVENTTPRRFAQCIELYRRRPVNGGRQDSVYFEHHTFRQVERTTPANGTINPSAPHVQTVQPPVYHSSADDRIIEQAKQILENRLAKGPAMSDPRAVKDYLTVTAPAGDREVFRAIWLDSQHNVISVETLAQGTINQSAVYPREVVKSALAAEAAACIVTHNHPSGSLEASAADKRLTDALKQALGTVDIRLLDHIITAGGKAVSLAERGEL